MDETLVCWSLIFFAMVWLQLGKSYTVQTWFHKGGSTVGFLCQWYTLLMIGLTYLWLRTCYDIIKFEYIGYDFLRSPKINENLITIFEMQARADPHTWTPRFQHHHVADLQMSPWIRNLSLIAPLFGSIAFAAVIGVVMYAARSGRRDSAPYPEVMWMNGKRANLVVLVILTPMVAIVMSMRAMVRQWAVMTGSCYIPMIREFGAAGVPTESWIDVKKLEAATYDADLELSSCFQFITISLFAVLCADHLSRSDYLQFDRMSDGIRRQYTHALKWLSIQGVFAYVVVGLVRSLIVLGCTVAKEYPQYEKIADSIQTHGLDKTDTVFTFVTIFAVLNMQVICGMEDIRDKLGKNVNLKFQGTRILLLISQIQLKVLSALTVGSTGYLALLEHLEKAHGMLWLKQSVEKYAFGTQKARMLHASLLCIECFLVVILNGVAWRMTPDMKHKLMSNIAEDYNIPTNEIREALLSKK